MANTGRAECRQTNSRRSPGLRESIGKLVRRGMSWHKPWEN